MALWRSDKEALPEVKSESPKPASSTLAPLPHAIGGLHGQAKRRGDSAPDSAGAPQRTLIASDLTIIGNLVSKGEVRVEGEIQGDVQCAKVVFGQGSRLTGTVIADDIVVDGVIQGSIRGNKVTLHAASRVEGDIHHQSLSIDEGAFFEGKSRRTANPTEGAASFSGDNEH